MGKGWNPGSAKSWKRSNKATNDWFKGPDDEHGVNFDPVVDGQANFWENAGKNTKDFAQDAKEWFEGDFWWLVGLCAVVVVASAALDNSGAVNITNDPTGGAGRVL
jgi:hypothetical protein